jgi:alkylation response protein AidB-like acyl-CoA dehydrogenase
VDFTFDAEQLALQEVARTALERECDPAMVRALVEDPVGMTPALWQTLVDLGWTGLLIDESLGGTGTGLLEMTIVAEQMGRLPLPGPFFSSAVAATLAARALGADHLLADLAAGTKRGTVALGEQGHGDPLSTVRTRARRKSADWVLTGSKPFVIDGHSADWVIVVARSEEGVRSYLLEDAAAEVVPSLDPTRKLARLILDETKVVPLGPPGSQGALWSRVQDDIAVVLAAETVGAANRALGDAIAYTSERIVFDRPVATYQTVRHRLVEMFQQVEMARAGVQFAAWASDTDADAGVRVTGDDIQLHGGVGFTWANDAHFLFKRVKQNGALSGGVGPARERLATLFIESA